MSKLITALSLVMILNFVGTASAKSAGKWEINKFENFVIASVRGEITDGEKQRFAFLQNDCSKVQHLFSIYTTVQRDFSSLEGKIIVINFNEEKIGGRVIATENFYNSTIMMVDLGVYDKDFLIQHLKKFQTIKIQLIDGNGITASEYFDVLENTWAITGIEGIFAEAQRVCRENPQKKSA